MRTVRTRNNGNCFIEQYELIGMRITVQIGEHGIFTDVQIGERGKQRVKSMGQLCFLGLRVKSMGKLLAQLVRRLTCNPRIDGSSPAEGHFLVFLFSFCFAWLEINM